jgi:hypothetical protein
MARRQTEFPESATDMPIAGAFRFAPALDPPEIGNSCQKKAGINDDDPST